MKKCLQTLSVTDGIGEYTISHDVTKSVTFSIFEYIM